MKNTFIISAFLLTLVLCNTIITVSTLFAETKKAKHPSKITNSLGMEFVYIKPGEFIMGAQKGDDSYYFGVDKSMKVTFTEGFYMQTTEVTQGQWTRIMRRNPSDNKDCGDSCPVETVSWDEVQFFIKLLNLRDNKDGIEGIYRLPYEAEWEYCCRAGTTTIFSFGNCITSDQVNYKGLRPLPGCPKSNYLRKTAPVASYPPNPWGLYDMHGNVSEWCEDWFYDNYIHTPTKYPVQDLYKSMPEARYKVVRGGGMDLMLSFLKVLTVLTMSL